VRHRRERPRAVAFALACVLAALTASQLHRTAHFAFERHVPCEHGHWVHPGGHAHSTATGEAAHGSSEAAGPAARSDAASNGSHNHCDALAVEHGVMPAVPHAPLEQLLAWEIALDDGEGIVAPTAVPLWLLAPKQSPPIV
jgi:hypothetical protein